MSAYPVFQFLQVRGTNPNPGRVELGDGTNSLTIQASSATTNHTLNLPDSAGVAGDFLELTSTSNTQWATPSTPQTIEIWDISLERVSGSTGGGLSLDVWETVELNTLSKPAGVGTDVQLAVAPAGTNQILLQPGEYEYFSITPAVVTDAVTVRLQNVTNNTTLLEGASALGDGRPNSTVGQGQLYMSGIITVVSQIVVQLEARRTGGQFTAMNLGTAIGAPGIPEVFTQMQFLRVL